MVPFEWDVGFYKNHLSFARNFCIGPSKDSFQDPEPLSIFFVAKKKLQQMWEDDETHEFIHFGLRHFWLFFILGYPLSRWGRSRDRLVSGCMASPPWRWSFGRRSLHIGAWQVPTAAGGGMRLERLEASFLYWIFFCEVFWEWHAIWLGR